MRYPEFLKKGDTIGITAPSDGVKKDVDFVRFDNGAQILFTKGIHCVETDNVRHSEKARSSSAKERAKQFLTLWDDPSVKAIVSAKGGEFLMEMLPYLDYEHLKQNPKWFQGYSDNTGIEFTLTTLSDVASIYSNNFGDFGMETWHPSVENNYEILTGNLVEQKSFTMYEDGFYDKETGKEGYVLTKEVKWRNPRGNEPVEMSGRLLGGCLDVLLALCGTKYDRVKEFNQRYQEDGILWFLESFNLTGESLQLGLWQLKEAGWFEHAKGFVFGRPCFFESYTGTSYEEAVLNVLGECNVPIILDADIGHKAPQFTVINGSIGTVSLKNGFGSLTMELK